ncbi:hypothetical protein [Desulfobacula sp.]|uniref:hypothetical protein n=1 Tax=Desulfobacula sp. TaxID=2593537 RepID=UPI0025BAF99D|nr:hypothetical protein [Desulfobacula sp.]
MLKEGWDVKNVTTIVGLRAYSAKSNILPEQTLGRGLRKMYPGNEVEEYVSVVGTDAFMDFVKSIQSEGVELERKAMDASLVTDYRSVIGYFSQIIMKDLRLVSGYDVLYGKVKSFIQNDLFEIRVDLDSLNTLRNLSELEASKTLVETFKKQINALTIQDKGDAKIKDFIKLKKTRPFVVKEQGYIVPKKSIFNKIIGDSHLELKFAAFLEECDDIISYVKNYMAVHFQIDYVNADGNISNYYPDFIVKYSSNLVVIVETKGLEDLDVPLKMKRLREWCVDINKAQPDIHYDYIFVDEESFNQYKPKNFEALMSGFRDYKD